MNNTNVNLPTMEEFSTVFYTYTFQLHISCPNKKTTTVCIKNLSQDTKKFLEMTDLYHPSKRKL